MLLNVVFSHQGDIMNKMQKTLNIRALKARAIAMSLCLCAVGVFSFWGTASVVREVHADGGVVCLYAGLEYSVGACRDGQRCSETGTWIDGCGTGN